MNKITAKVILGLVAFKAALLLVAAFITGSLISE